MALSKRISPYPAYHTGERHTFFGKPGSLFVHVEKPTRERVLSVLAHDPLSGIVTWRVDRGRTAKAGGVAGTIERDGRNTYRRIGLFGKKYYAHVLVWLIETGSWPPEGMEVAHDDQNGLNNHIGNLSLLTRVENLENQRRRTNNTSGNLGVHWNKRSKKWLALIMVQGKAIYLGLIH